MTTSEETLTLKVFSDDISMSGNNTEDDDIILASQAQRQHKLKKNMKLEHVKEHDNLSDTDTTHQSYSLFSLIDNKEKNSIKSKTFKNTQEDMFVSDVNIQKNKRVLPIINKSQSMLPSEKNQTLELSVNFIGDKTELINSQFINKLNSESFTKKSQVLTSSIDPSLPLFKDTLFCSSNIKYHSNQQERNISQVLFSCEDKTLSKVSSESYSDECLTSGIIFSSQIQNPDKNTRIRCCMENLNSATPNIKSQNKNINNNVNYCRCKCDRNDESCSNIEAHSLHFTLSVTCMVVKCSNTNKLKKKSITSVTGHSDSLSSCWNPNKPVNKSRKCSVDEAIRHRTTMDSLEQSEGFRKRKRALYGTGDTIDFVETRDDESDRSEGKGVFWTDQYLLEAKLDELLEDSLSKLVKKRDGMPWMQYDGKSGGKSSHGDTVLLEDADLFPSGRPTDENGLIEFLRRQTISETSISRRNSTDEETVAVIEHVVSPKEKVEESTTSDEIEESKSGNSSTRGDFGHSEEVEDSSTSEEKSTRHPKRIDRLEKGESVLAFSNSDSYYRSGSLVENEEGNIWRVQFDDKNVKLVREDHIISWRWLRPGDLVSVITDGQYLPGTLKRIYFGKSVTCDVELHDSGKHIAVDDKSLLLTDAMAEILKNRHTFPELYKTSGNSSNRPKSRSVDEYSKAATWVVKEETHVTRKKRYVDESKRPISGRARMGRTRMNCSSRTAGNRSKTFRRKQSRNKRRKVRRSFYAGLLSNLTEDTNRKVPK